MGYHWLSIALMLITTYGGVHGVHFRGGSMSWRPAGNNQIELRYSVGFTAEFEPTEGDKCTEEAIINRDPLNIRGSAGQLICEACPEDNKKFDWICDGIDRSEDSAWGSYSMLYDVPQDQFEISNQGCCWIDLQSPIGAGGAKGWKMLAYVDMTPHRTTGEINSSPVAANVPLEKFYQGCQYNLRIAASDPDNDEVRCRYANSKKGECHDTHTKACGPPTDGLTINSKNCILYFDTTDIGQGYHAVNVIIEDFAKPASRKSKPMSRVSLLFLMEVGDFSETCAKPVIIDPPPQCMMVRPGEQTNLVIKADPGDPLKPIVKIRAQGPAGMTQSALDDDLQVPGRKRKTLTWTPTEDQVGEALPISYSALDNERYTSGAEFTFIHVSNDEPLQVDPVNSEPAPGDEVTGFPYIINVAFNREILKADKQAKIRLRNAETGEIIYEINAAGKSPFVQHSGSKMTLMFNDPDGLIAGQTRVNLELDEGVAIPADGRGCPSQPAQWEILLGAKATVAPLIITTPAPPPAERPVACEGNTMYIPVPEGVKPGDKCFLHVADKAIVTAGEITTSYKLCCPTNCSRIGGAAIESFLEVQR